MRLGLLLGLALTDAPNDPSVSLRLEDGRILLSATGAGAIDLALTQDGGATVETPVQVQDLERRPVLLAPPGGAVDPDAPGHFTIRPALWLVKAGASPVRQIHHTGSGDLVGQVYQPGSGEAGTTLTITETITVDGQSASASASITLPA